MRLTHTRLLVDDFDTSLSFYRDTLGFRVGIEVGGTYAEFESGEATLAIYRGDLMAGVTGTPVSADSPRDDVVVTLAVDSVDETFERLRAKGVDFVTEPHDQEAWVLRVAHFRDPDGHLLEVYEPLRTAR